MRSSSTSRRTTSLRYGSTRAGASDASPSTCPGGATPAEGGSGGRHAPVHPMALPCPPCCDPRLEGRSSGVHRGTRVRSPGLPTFPLVGPLLSGTSGLMSRGPQLKLSTKSRATALSVALAGSLALTACGAANETDAAGSGAGGGEGAQLSGDLVGAGASSQQAAMEAWQAGFQGEYPDV